MSGSRAFVMTLTKRIGFPVGSEVIKVAAC